MEARAIQIYKPVNKNEVRLVYRIKNSAVSGENGRHQKSYSFNKYGEENAWNMARDAFKFINSNNKLPFDFSDPWKMKLINKRGRRSLNYNGSSMDEQNSPIISNKRSSTIKSEIYGDKLIESNVLGGRNTSSLSPPSISCVKYSSLKDSYDVDSSSSTISPQASPNFIYKFEKKLTDLEIKNGHQDNHLPSSSYLYLLATAATEIFEKQEVKVNLESEKKLESLGNINETLQENFKDPKITLIPQSRVDHSSFDSLVNHKTLQANHQNQCIGTNMAQQFSSSWLSPSTLSQTLLPEIPKIILNPDSYFNLANMPYYNVPLFFNQANSQYASALINNANQHVILLEPSVPYLTSNNNASKIQIPK